MPGASWPRVQSKAIELVHSTLVVQDPRCSMALGALEGNRTSPFNSGGTGSQALHGLWCNRTRPFDSGGEVSQVLHGLRGNLRQSHSLV